MAWTRYNIQEWLADRISWVQYPKPVVRSLSGHPVGWRSRWATRPRINHWLAFVAPTFCLFMPDGVYLAIGCFVFLLVYFAA